jgi:lysyl-tRNA synthetase class 2
MTGRLSDDWRPTATLETLRLRAQLLGRARAYFTRTGALEVETPVLVRAAVTDVHLESLEVLRTDGQRAGFLHTSPEYAMKRLLCAGAPDIYQVAHVFREGERGRRHNPEFTMIEWYRLGMDQFALMRDVDGLLRTLLEPSRPVGPTVHVTYAEACEAALGVNPLTATTDEIAASLDRAGLDVPPGLRSDRDGLLDLGMSLHVTARFPEDRITFVRDFPASQAALARVNGPVAARFEAFWGALELANGFHELGDASEQTQRFASDAATRSERGLPARDIDQRFLAALAAGLPACAGVALGFDRVVMIAAGAREIDEVIAFPIERA